MMAAAGFWDNPKHSQTLVAELQRLTLSLKPLQELSSQADDLVVLLELAPEDDSGESETELAGHSQYHPFLLATVTPGPLHHGGHTGSAHHRPKDLFRGESPDLGNGEVTLRTRVPFPPPGGDLVRLGSRDRLDQPMDVEIVGDEIPGQPLEQLWV